MNTEPITQAQARVVRGNLAILKSGALNGQVRRKEMGVQDDDLLLITQSAPFMHTDRVRVRTLISSFATAALDMAGAPVFDMDAEHYAAVIVGIVEPQNWQVVCSWIGKLPSNMELIDDPTETQGMHPAKLYALCTLTNAMPGIRDDVLNTRYAIAKELFERKGDETEKT